MANANPPPAASASSRSDLLQCPQYLAYPESTSYASWDQLSGRDNAHHLARDGDHAILVIVGQISADRLSVGPLGNYQSQEEKYSNAAFRVECKDAKLVFTLRSPTSYPEWTADFDTAISNIETLQTAITQGTAPCMWFLDKTEATGTLRFVRNLWETKAIITFSHRKPLLTFVPGLFPRHRRRRRRQQLQPRQNR